MTLGPHARRGKHVRPGCHAKDPWDPGHAGLLSPASTTLALSLRVL